MRNDIKNDFKKIKNDLKNHNFEKQIANILTASRLLSPFILIPLIYYEKLLPAVIMVILFGLTDTFDGYFARKYNATSLFGKYLDAVVDKIFALSLLIPVILKATLSVDGYGLVLVNIFLEIVIACLNLYSFFRNLQPESTILGKIKTIFLFTLLGILYLSRIIYIKNIYISIFIIITIIMQIIAIFSYIGQIKMRKLNASV